MPTNSNDILTADLKLKLREHLPKSAFNTNPLRMLWVPFWIGIALVAGYVILATPAHWLIKVLLGIVMGHSWAILNFISHEVLHGGMGGSDKTQRVVGNICGIPLMIPSELWRSAHMRRHHAHTNRDMKDVDTLGHMHRYIGHPGAQKVIDKYPGAGRWSSLLYYAYGFTYQHIQTARMMKGDKGRTVRNQMVMMAGFWVVISLLSGLDFMYTVIIPFITANAIAMGYISTQHWIRPLSNDNNAVETTLGLTQPKWLEALHFNNAYHLEHHLFPALPFNKLPLVREALLKEFPEKVIVLPHWQALTWVFKTPRIYADNNHLIDLRNPDKWFDLKAFERAILDPKTDLSKASMTDFLVPAGGKEVFQ